MSASRAMRGERWSGGRSGRAGRSLLAVLSLAAALGAPATTGAQEPEFVLGEERQVPASRLTVGLYTGALAPINDLASDPNSFGAAITVAPIVGLEAIYWPGGGNLGFGVQGFFAPGELQPRPTEFQGAVPSELGDADYFAGTASVLYRLRLAGLRGRIEPYFGAGVGLRHLSVDPIASPEVVDTTDPLGTILAGTNTWVSSRLAFRFEVRDHLLSLDGPTTGESKLQNDVAVTIGLSGRIR